MSLIDRVAKALRKKLIKEKVIEPRSDDSDFGLSEKSHQKQAGKNELLENQKGSFRSANQQSEVEESKASFCKTTYEKINQERFEFQIKNLTNQSQSGLKS